MGAIAQLHGVLIISADSGFSAAAAAAVKDSSTVGYTKAFLSIFTFVTPSVFRITSRNRITMQNHAVYPYRVRFQTFSAKKTESGNLSAMNIHFAQVW
jgi:hypothetical protein